MVAAYAVCTAALVVAFGTQAEGYRPGDETCTYSPSSQCPVDALKVSATDGSALIYPGGKTRCAFDDFVDPAGAFTANKTFFFQVFPRKESKKLLLFMQGGGSCIDNSTCSFALQCSLGTSQMTASVARAANYGLLNTSDPDNAFREWNIVHIPYCTGDLGIGNRTVDPYESGLESYFQRPQCLGKKQNMYLNGFENSKAAIGWAFTNFPGTTDLVLAGSSAGSLGAQVLGAYVAHMWDVTKNNIRYGILADSEVGVLPNTTTASQSLHYLGTCELDLQLPAATMAACKAETLTTVELIKTVIQATPQSNWLFISSIADHTQRYFYELMSQGIIGYPFTNLISASDFSIQMNVILDAYKTVSEGVTTFLIPGEEHVFLEHPGFSQVASITSETLGARLTKWLGQSAASNNGATTTPPKTSSSSATRMFAPLAMALVAIAMIAAL